MKRAVWLLLLLFSAWLFALPGVRLRPAPPRAPTASVRDRNESSCIAHVAAESVTPQVLRAPLWSRLPISTPELRPDREPWLRAAAARPRDRRAALRRVQTRRRVPRLSAGEPPWS